MTKSSGCSSLFALSIPTSWKSKDGRVQKWRYMNAAHVEAVAAMLERKLQALGVEPGKLDELVRGFQLAIFGHGDDGGNLDQARGECAEQMGAELDKYPGHVVAAGVYRRRALAELERRKWAARRAG